MAFPSISNYLTHQGVVIAELAITLVLYSLLKIIHYLKWGHLEEVGAD